jgi:hypothetical protein
MVLICDIYRYPEFSADWWEWVLDLGIIRRQAMCCSALMVLLSSTNPSKRTFRCTVCKRRESAKIGTILEDSKLSINNWIMLGICFDGKCTQAQMCLLSGLSSKAVSRSFMKFSALSFMSWRTRRESIFDALKRQTAGTTVTYVTYRVCY